MLELLLALPQPPDRELQHLQYMELFSETGLERLHIRSVIPDRWALGTGKSKLQYRELFSWALFQYKDAMLSYLTGMVNFNHVVEKMVTELTILVK